MSDFKVSFEVEGPAVEDERGYPRRETRDKIEVIVSEAAANEIVAAVHLLLSKVGE